MSDRLKYYQQLWDLSDDGGALSTHSSLLWPVIYEGAKCMLKIATGDEERAGNSLMVWYNGNAVPRILQHDETALLMERASGSRSLAEMAKNGNDDEASRIICSVTAKLHSQKGSYPNNLVPLQTWFKDLASAAGKYGGVFEQCSKIANTLLDNPTNFNILHGDIHHGNILDFGGKGWLAIDPKGLIGERGFDYANLFCNPDIATATKPGRLLQQVQIVSAKANLDPQRLLQWIAAWAGLSAAWSLNDGGTAEPAMTIAEMTLSKLNNI